ncbi:inactive hydroxysteroid dehydrogenase-like protein 1 [Ambystoma mexicanum]|uniref:inactive hydroxysteroid dehydrogenase-like protein 1 n=1 Tax=Ambystoma mexicanum TaxID=8296 RepID=UPI0037E8DEB9
MAAVDSFHLLYREIARSCHSYVETLALIGAWYTVRKSLHLLGGCCGLLKLHFIPHLVGRIDLLKRYGEWAVVTGATSGIGKAYAEELARRGVNVILISRNREKLESISEEITETYKVKTAFVVADFCMGSEIYSSIRKALNEIDIGILVNNAGVNYDYPEYFGLIPEAKLWEIINVNVAAATMMANIVLPGMVARGKGAIVNISSATHFRPLPQLAGYTASKAYLYHFSRVLHHEYASKGIFVQTLTPGCVVTNMISFSRKLCNSPWLVPSASVYARHAVSTLGFSTNTTGYWSHSIQVRTKLMMNGKRQRFDGASMVESSVHTSGQRCSIIPVQLRRVSSGVRGSLVVGC